MAFSTIPLSGKYAAQNTHSPSESALDIAPEEEILNKELIAKLQKSPGLQRDNSLRSIPYPTFALTNLRSPTYCHSTDSIDMGHKLVKLPYLSRP